MKFRRESGVLFRPKESWSPVVSPPDAVKRGVLSERKTKHVLQNRVHYILTSYLNGHSLGESPVLRKELTNLGIADKGDSLDDLISQFYRHFDSIMPDGGSTETVSLDRFDESAYKSSDLEREVIQIVDVLREASEHLKTACLQGSFGDKSYIREYSDVDLLIVVNTDTLTNKKQLNELREVLISLRRHLFYIDPHQHHGVVAIAEPDLQSYNRAYLPPVALSQGKTICGESPIEFVVRDDKLERRHGFWRVLQRFRYAVDEGAFPVSFDGGQMTHERTGPLYCFKYFTSLVQLLPSLWATARGTPTYKADSFDLIPNESTFNIIENCSEIRLRYPEVITFRRDDEYREALRTDEEWARREMQPTTVPTELWKILGPAYFVQALRAAEELWAEVT